MKQKWYFSKRLLSIVLCLSLVFTSANFPVMTVEAEETQTEADVTTETATADVTETQIQAEGEDTSQQTTQEDVEIIAETEEQAQAVVETETQVTVADDNEKDDVTKTQTTEDKEAEVVTETASSVKTENDDELEVQDVPNIGMTVTVSGSRIHIVAGAAQNKKFYIYKENGTKGDPYTDKNHTDGIFTGTDFYVAMPETGTYIIEVEVFDINNGTALGTVKEAAVINSLVPGAPIAFEPVYENSHPGSIHVKWNRPVNSGIYDGVGDLQITHFSIKIGEVTAFANVNEDKYLEGLEAGKYVLTLIAHNKYGASEGTVSYEIDVKASAPDDEIVYNPEDVKKPIDENAAPAKPIGFKAEYNESKDTINVSWSEQLGIGTVPKEYIISINGVVVDTIEYGTTAVEIPNVSDSYSGETKVSIVAKNDKGVQSEPAEITLTLPVLSTPEINETNTKYNQTDDTIDVYLNETDGIVPTEYIVSVDGAKVEDATINGNVIKIPASDYTSGNHTVSIVAKKGDKETEAAEISVSVPSLEAPKTVEAKYNKDDDTVVVTWELTDTTSQPTDYEFYVDGNKVDVEKNKYSLSTKIPNTYTSGEHEIKVVAVRGEEKTETTTKVTIPEKVEITELKAEYVQKKDVIEVSWQVPGLSPDAYVFYVDDVEVEAKMSNVLNLKATIPNDYKAGEHTIKVVAKKSDEEAATIETKVTIPELAAPAEMKAEYNKNKDTVDVTWTQDGVKPDDYIVYVDGEKVEDIDTDTIPVQIPNSFESGKHTVKVVAVKDGEEKEGTEIEFTVPELTAPTGFTAEYDEVANKINIEWTQDGVKADNYIIYVDGEEAGTVKGSNTSAKLDNNYSAGVHEISISAKKSDEVTEPVKTTVTLPYINFDKLKEYDNFYWYEGSDHNWYGDFVDEATDKYPEGELATNGKEVTVDCTNIGQYSTENDGKDDLWQIHIKALENLLKAGKKYTISFNVESDKDKDVTFRMEKSSDNSAIEGTQKPIDLKAGETEFIEFELDRTGEAEDLYADLVFAFGYQGDDKEKAQAEITVSNLKIYYLDENGNPVYGSGADAPVDEDALAAKKEELKNLIDKIKTDYPNDEKFEYDEDTWDDLQEALKKAEEALKKDDADISDIKGAIKDLQDAVDGLEYKRVKVTISEQKDVAYAGNDITLTYTADDDSFEFGDSFTVKINGAEQDINSLTFDKNKKTIKIPAALVAAPGTYKIEFAPKNDEVLCDLTPVYQTVYAADDKWVPYWSDEFDGTSNANANGLDTTKWDYQTGDGSKYGETGWGSDEKQTHTMSPDNLKVEDGQLTITAKKNSDGSYTSARIRTVEENTGKDLKIGKYGKIEAKMKLPAADGAWPTFWMLPYNSKYAASGEIDIMQARGRVPSEVTGAIHYGDVAPNNKYSTVSKTFESGTDFTEYHVYAVEWNPTSITWLVDGTPYATLSNWYSVAGEEGNWPYPAPFDEEFYLLLDLAVGGDFDPEVTQDSDIKITENGVSMEVDYVRWYQREAGYFDGIDMTEPEVEKDTSKTAEELLKECDSEGNFLKDSKFEEYAKTDKQPITNPNDLNIEKGKWIPLVLDEYEGKATLDTDKTIINGQEQNGLKANVTDRGTEWYSAQMIQYFPLVKGYSYIVSYDAYTSTDAKKADISLKIGGDTDNSWTVYSSVYTDDLTTTPQTYTHRFTMTEETDPTARFEFNLASSEGVVYVTNVSVKLLKDGLAESDGEDEAKKPLSDGNHIYNGDFNMGSDGLLYWHWTDENSDPTSVKVVNGENGERVAEITADSKNPISIWQNGIQLLKNEEYKLTFNVDSEAAQNIKIQFTNADGTVVYNEPEIEKKIDAGSGVVEYTFTQPSVTDENAKLTITFEDSATIDKLKLIRTTNNNTDWDSVEKWPIYNGDFFNGLDGWILWHEGSCWQSAIVNTEKQLETQIKVGKDAYPSNVGIKTKKDITLTKNIMYKVSFDYTLPENKTYTLKIADVEKEITLKKGSHTYVSEAIRGTGNTKFELWFGNTQSDIYTLNLDNVLVYIDPDSLDSGSVEKLKNYAQPVSLATKDLYRVNSDVTILFSENAAWDDAEGKQFWLDGNEIAADKIKIDYEKNEITISKDLFTEVGAYSFMIGATGFCDTKPLSLEVLPNNNLIGNGDFSEGQGEWILWYNPESSNATLEIKDEVAVVNHVGHGGNEWDIQLYREGINYEAGDYVLSFDAWTDADGDRPIIAQLQNGNDPAISGTLNKVTLGTEAKNYKFLLSDLVANNNVKLNFFLGEIENNGAWADNQDPYNIYFDNVVLEPATDAHLKVLPARLAVSEGASVEDKAIDVTYEYASDEWKATGKTVYVNNNAISPEYVTYNKDGFTISGDVFAEEGRYFIYVIAEGYSATNTVYKNVLNKNGNLIIDGELNNPDGWYVYNEQTDGGLSYGTIEDGHFNLDYNSGYFREDMNCWNTWQTYLAKENISVPEPSEDYVLKFTATTDLDGGREIIVQYDDGKGNKGSVNVVVSEGDAKVYEAKIPVAVITDDLKLEILTGPIGENLQKDKTNANGNEANTVPHNLTIDNLYFGLAEDYLDKIKTDLKDLIDEYDDIKQENYTDESWKDFQDALDNAKDVIDNPLSTEKDIEDAIDSLKKAYNNLEIVKGLWTRYVPDQIYTGKAIKPVVEVFNNIEYVDENGVTQIEERPLVLKKDYTVKYKNNKNVTDGATVIVKGKGNYTKPDEVKFRILPKNLDNSDDTVDKVTVTDVYAVIKNGAVKKLPKVTVKYGKKKLKEGKDYQINWPKEYTKDEAGNLIPDRYEVEISAINDATCNFTGTTTFTYDIVDANALLMSKAKIKVDTNKVEYNHDFPENTYKPVVTEVKIGKTVIDPRFYEVEYPEAQIGKVKMTITGITEYGVYGSKTFTYTITGTKLNNKNISIAGKGIDDGISYQYTGEAITVEGLALYDLNRKAEDGTSNYQLIEGDDYTVKYEKNVKAGTAKVTFTGTGAYTGKLTKNFKIDKRDITTCNNEGSIITFSFKDGLAQADYTKKGAMPEFTVVNTVTGEELAAKKDFTVSYEGNKEITKAATLKIKGKGNYTGEFTQTFEVKSPDPVATNDNTDKTAIYAIAKDIVVPKSVEKLKAKVTVYEQSTGKKLKAGVDYSKDFKLTVINEDGTVKEAIEATDLKPDTVIGVEITLTGNYSYAETKTINTTFRLYNKALKANKVFKVQLPKEKTYTGLAITLAEDELVVTDKNDSTKVLKLGEDYTVEYVNNVKKGTAKVIITGCGNGYGGTKTAKFKIKAKEIVWANNPVVSTGLAKALSDIINKTANFN